MLFRLGGVGSSRETRRETRAVTCASMRRYARARYRAFVSTGPRNYAGTGVLAIEAAVLDCARLCWRAGWRAGLVQTRREQCSAAMNTATVDVSTPMYLSTLLHQHNAGVSLRACGDKWAWRTAPRRRAAWRPPEAGMCTASPRSYLDITFPVGSACPTPLHLTAQCLELCVLLPGPDRPQLSFL